MEQGGAGAAEERVYEDKDSDWAGQAMAGVAAGRAAGPSIASGDCCGLGQPSAARRFASNPVHGPCGGFSLGRPEKTMYKPKYHVFARFTSRGDPG